MRNLPAIRTAGPESLVEDIIISLHRSISSTYNCQQLMLLAIIIVSGGNLSVKDNIILKQETCSMLYYLCQRTTEGLICIACAHRK